MKIKNRRLELRRFLYALSETPTHTHPFRPTTPGLTLAAELLTQIWSLQAQGLSEEEIIDYLIQQPEIEDTEASRTLLQEACRAMLDLNANDTPPEGIVLGVSERFMVRLRYVNSAIARLLQLLDGTRTLEDLTGALQDEGYALTSSTLEGILDGLANAGLLFSYPIDQKPIAQQAAKFSRYDRQLVYFSTFCDSIEECYSFQERLENSCVVLIGLGGIGSNVLMQLAGAGVGRLIGVDPDDVELSNLNRQFLFTESDIGNGKADVAAHEIAKRNSSVSIETYTCRISGEGDVLQFVREADFVVLSADTPRGLIARWVNNACVKAGIPFGRVGYVEGSGVCGPFVVPGTTACLDCASPGKYFRESSPHTDLLNQHFCPASFGPLNGLLASIVASECLKYLAGYSSCQLLGKRLLIDLTDLSITSEECLRNADCPTCGTVTERGRRNV